MSSHPHNFDQQVEDLIQQAALVMFRGADEELRWHAIEVLIAAAQEMPSDEVILEAVTRKIIIPSIEAILDEPH